MGWGEMGLASGVEGYSLVDCLCIDRRRLGKRDKVGGPLINARWLRGTLTVSEGNSPRTLKEVANSFSFSLQPFARSSFLWQSKRPQSLTISE